MDLSAAWQMSQLGVRHEKAALSSRCKKPDPTTAQPVVNTAMHRLTAAK
jgi:hypothetical protein